MTGFKINTLTIIGTGLIGGSLARALCKANCVSTVIGAGRNLEHLKQAQQLGVIDEFTTDLADAASRADVIVLAVPLGAIEPVLNKIKDSLGSETILTDVASAKQHVNQAVKTVFGCLPAHYIGGHPIAGTEKSGVTASFAELFEQRRVILTPHKDVADAVLNRVAMMWKVCGAEVITMDAKHHDEVLAATSHLPHMLAYALVDTLARRDDSQEIFDFAAGGFRDFTRIASSDPDMWHDICVANRESMVQVLREFNEDLHRLTQAVEQGDSEFLKETFTRAKKSRDEFCG